MISTNQKLALQVWNDDLFLTINGSVRVLVTLPISVRPKLKNLFNITSAMKRPLRAKVQKIFRKDEKTINVAPMTLPSV